MSKKDEGVIGVLCDSIYLVVPGQFAIGIMPSYFAMLCSRSPGLVTLCQRLAFSYFDLGLQSMARDNM